MFLAQIEFAQWMFLILVGLFVLWRVAPQFHPMHIRTSAQNWSCEVLDIEPHSDGVYMVRLRFTSGAVKTARCKVDCFNGVTWFSEMFVHRQAELSTQTCLSCEEVFPVTDIECPKCGWSFMKDDSHRLVARFKIPERSDPLPKCLFRLYTAADFESCAEIYRLNEPGRFPDGYYDHFSHWLRNSRSLVLVCEVDGDIRGFGGISMLRTPRDTAALAYGMIHPTYHKLGYGTALLLARLSILPEPDEAWYVSMTTVSASESFYSRFGFEGSEWLEEAGIKMVNYNTFLNAADWQKCRGELSGAEISVSAAGAIIPATTFDQIPILAAPAHPPDPRSA